MGLVMEACVPAGADPRVGLLLREGRVVFYAFVDGYANPPLEGPLEAVQRALEVSDARRGTGSLVRKAKPPLRAARSYLVTVTPRFVTYCGSTVNGAYKVEVLAQTREQAIQRARADRRLQEGRHAVPAAYRARLAKNRESAA